LAGWAGWAGWAGKINRIVGIINPVNPVNPVNRTKYIKSNPFLKFHVAVLTDTGVKLHYRL
jgi:hypothetical protein